MESDLAIPSDKGKVDHVAITITDEEEQASPANPQFFLYFFNLYLMALFFSGLSQALPPVLQDRKQSPFKAPRGVFFIMVIVTISVTILASAILIFTSYFLKNYMRNIHYTILKSIGMLSGFLVIFSTGCVIFLTDKLDWRYSVMGVIFIGILVLYYFVWKYTLVHQQNKNFNEFPVDWTVLLAWFFVVSVPLSVMLHRIIPKKLFWVHILIILAQLSALVPVIVKLVKRYKTRTQGTSSPVIQQDSQTKTIIHPSVATCKI